VQFVFDFRFLNFSFCLVTVPSLDDWEKEWSRQCFEEWRHRFDRTKNSAEFGRVGCLGANQSFGLRRQRWHRQNASGKNHPANGSQHGDVLPARLGLATVG